MSEENTVILVSGGKTTKRYIDRLVDTVGGKLKKVYNTVDSLPRKLPTADLLFFISSSISHSVEGQIRARAKKGTLIIPLDHHWSKAFKSLEERGLIVNPPKMSPKVTFTSWPTMNGFMRELLHRCPAFGSDTLVHLRHSEQVTPVQLATSLQSVLSSVRRAAKEIEYSWSPNSAREPDFEKIQTICSDILGDLVPPPQNPKIALKINVVRCWADKISYTGVPMRGCSFKTTQSGTGSQRLRLPSGWCVTDVHEAHRLAEGKAVSKNEIGPSTYLSLLREALEENGIQQGTAQSKVRQPDLLLKDPKTPTMNRQVFMRVLSDKLPDMTLSDWAWLRQEEDVWPIRTGNRRTYFPVSAKNPHNGRYRAYKDEELLEAAYDTVADHPPPEEPEFTTKKMSAISKLAEWYSAGPYVLSNQERDRILTSLPVDGLTEHDFAEAIDLAACGEEKTVWKGPRWKEDLLELFVPEGYPIISSKIPTPKQPEPRKKPTPVQEAKVQQQVTQAVEESGSAPSEDVLMELAGRLKDFLGSSGLESIHVSASGRVTVEEIVIKKRSFNID